MAPVTTDRPNAELEIGATQPNEPQSIALPARYWLHFVYPRELLGQSMELIDGLTLGREPASSAAREPASPAGYVCVPHATISRRHARIHDTFGVAYIRDLGSSNGTRVNGVSAAEGKPLLPDSVVRLGDALAVVDEATPPESLGHSSSVPGISPQLERLRGLLARAAPQALPVLIFGETGTGKEWLAADIHRSSGRRGPYLKLSCAELSPQLIESQLFGHERGAFTGADARQIGLFLAAQQGTLFLDEIGELPLESQAKLLRVLQEREVRPVGSLRTYATDARVVCATHRDLHRDVEEGRFRRDLLARLSVFELELPPLRERRLDILPWVDRLCQRSGRDPGTLRWQPAAAERLLLADWPDNLRGIDRLVQRLLAHGSSVTVGMQLLRETMPELCDDSSQQQHGEQAAARASTEANSPPAAAVRSPSAALPTRDEFLAVFEATGRNVRATSKHFGRDRRQIYRWLASFGIER